MTTKIQKPVSSQKALSLLKQRVLAGKTKECDDIMRVAKHLASEFLHPRLEVEHVFAGIAWHLEETTLSNNMLRKLGMSSKHIREKIPELWVIPRFAENDEKPDTSSKVERVLLFARALAKSKNAHFSHLHILIALLVCNGNIRILDLLNRLGISDEDLKAETLKKLEIPLSQWESLKATASCVVESIVS